MTTTQDTGERAGLSIRNRSRLPQGRSLTVNVTRFRMPGVLLLVGAITFIAFLTGVAAGTGGWYREVIIGLTTPLPEESTLRRILLRPDQTAGEPPMRARLDTIEARLGETSDTLNTAIKKYSDISSAYGSFDADVTALRNATLKLADIVVNARDASTATKEQLDALILAVETAQQARVADLETPVSQSDLGDPSDGE